MYIVDFEVSKYQYTKKDEAINSSSGVCSVKM